MPGCGRRLSRRWTPAQLPPPRRGRQLVQARLRLRAPRWGMNGARTVRALAISRRVPLLSQEGACGRFAWKVSFIHLPFICKSAHSSLDYVTFVARVIPGPRPGRSRPAASRKVNGIACARDLDSPPDQIA